MENLHLGRDRKFDLEMLAAYDRFRDRSEREAAFLWEPRDAVKRNLNL
jgi:hypothetical protein